MKIGSYQLLYHPDIASKDLPHIDRKQQRKIQKAIESRLFQDPFQYGAPLRRSLKGYRKLRVGDYRVIYELVESQIRIYAIGHRKEVYARKLRDWKEVL